MCVCVCVCVYFVRVCVFGVNCSIKLGQEGRIFLLIFDHYFFSMPRACGTLKQNLVKFLTTLKPLTKRSYTISITLNGTEIAQISHCFSRQMQDVVVAKETLNFSERSPLICCRFLRKRVQGRQFLAGIFQPY